MANEKMLVSVSLDTSEIKKQILEIETLLPPSFTENISNNFLSMIKSRIFSLSNDIIFDYYSTTISTTHVIEIVFKVKIGRPFEPLTSAIRAMDIERADRDMF